MFHICKLRSTLDNSNFLGKSKKIRVTRSLKQIAGNKKILSKCMKRVVRDVDCVLNKEIKQQSLVNIQGVRGFRTSVQFFFLDWSHAVKHGSSYRG